MSSELPKAYDPSAIEEKWAKYWVEERLFDAATPAMGSVPKKAFVQLLPPPNVTGRLHMGHMLNQTEMDILARWHRMLGETSVWVPGTDHAGIATQMMVERQLQSEGGPTREDLGREAFTERVWQWKEQYGGAITEQMRRLGASVDWGREYFTMDERLSRAVKQAFVKLWEQGLIYRGAYIVNWDPQIQTAVSDLEVVHEERTGKLYHIRYDLADGPGSITIATTRPETMLADVAVAVNPHDERYKNLIGKMVVLPLSRVHGGPERQIPVIADDWAQPEFGTGAVKITPAHDPNDFSVGQRHDLPQPSVMDTRGNIALPGSPYDGMERFAARERIVADLEARGMLVAVKDHAMAIALSQRTGVIIEPRLSMQWFLAVNKTPKDGGESIAGKAIAAVREGHIRFTPEMYSKTYFEWMNNIHDWCISRQLWWGHRIPAWYCGACGKMTVTLDTPQACHGCGITDIRQETDVLDTWFSSGLLPFTVFGEAGRREKGEGKRKAETGGEGSLIPDPSSLFPDLSPELAAFYPTQLLVTGFDILFFWVARMIMLGSHFMQDVPMPDGTPRALKDAVPFRQVYIHALVRDAERQKMSKTKGNVIDPIEVVTKYGTDAVRFTLASQASPGTDIAFSEARTEGYRAFANKIWNAARFLQLHLDRAKQAGVQINLDGESLNKAIRSSSSERIKWIAIRFGRTAHAVHDSLSEYRFDEAASNIYQFFWGDYCDWFIEIAKGSLDQPNDPVARKETLTVLLGIFEAALRLLSPFMPFITEELWHVLYREHSSVRSIAVTTYPTKNEFQTFLQVDSLAERTISNVKDLITSVRAIRKDLGIPEKELVHIRVRLQHPELFGSFETNKDLVKRLARTQTIQIVDEPLLGSNARSSTVFDVAVVYERQIDAAAERERLTKELAKYDKGLQAAERQLGNEGFVAKAPAHIVEGLKKQAAETRGLKEKAEAALAALPAA